MENTLHRQRLNIKTWPIALLLLSMFVVVGIGSSNGKSMSQNCNTSCSDLNGKEVSHIIIDNIDLD